MPSILLFASGLLFTSLYGCLPVKRQKETYATYVRHEVFTQGHYYWEFYVKDKKYEVVAWRPYHGIIGDKYIIVYDSLKPGKRYEIQSDRPVFVEREVTGITVGTVTRDVCLPPRTSHSVEFDYTVNLDSYNNANGVPDRNTTDTIYLKKGDRFEVEYWRYNPQRSIIHLDKPVKQ